MKLSIVNLLQFHNQLILIINILKLIYYNSLIGIIFTFQQIFFILLLIKFFC